jgi:hypothetical protein
MSASAAILEQWLASAVAAYGEGVAPLAAAERDPFRNPVGATLRRQLAALVDEVVGNMDAAAIDAALEPIIAVRAIQELTLPQAVGFVFALRGILRRELPRRDAAELDARIDALALSAFGQFVRRREQLAELRFNERVRALGPLPYRLRTQADAAAAPRRE